MSKFIDETLSEFITKELGSINSDKDRINEEKRRIRTEIFELFKIDCLRRTDEQKEKLEFLRHYENVLIEQYSLLCKRDIAIFGLIANIGENSMREFQHYSAKNISGNDKSVESKFIEQEETEEYD